MWVLVFMCVSNCTSEQLSAALIVPNLTRTSCLFAANKLKQGRSDFEAVCLEQVAPFDVITKKQRVEVEK